MFGAYTKHPTACEKLFSLCYCPGGKTSEQENSVQELNNTFFVD